MNSKLLKQGYGYHKLCKAFKKLNYRHLDLTVKYNIFLKTLLQQGIQEPVFNAIHLKDLLESQILEINFRYSIKRLKKVGYNMDIMRQTACLVVNPITIDSYSFPFNCTAVGQASDLVMVLT